VLVRTFVELDGLTRDEWLDARRHGIGSSDAPAICGLDRWASPFSVWLDKTGRAEPEPDNPVLEWGRLLEEPIAQKYASDTGLAVASPAVMYQHDHIDWWLASPDREVFAPDGVRLGLVEIKSTALRDDWRDGVPERTKVQAQHQMAVTGDPWCDVACLMLPQREFTIERVERDDELIEIIARIETDFWEHVTQDVPPPTDGHPSTTEALALLYAHAQPDSRIDLPDEARELHAELLLAKQAKSDVEKDVDALTNALKGLLGEHEIGLLDGQVAVTWKAGKPKERIHNCPDCPHAPVGPPSRTFLPKRVKS